MSEQRPRTAAQDEFMQWMCRHLVTMVGTYHKLDREGNPEGDELFYCLPGFVVQMDDLWCWVTAGHNLREVLGEYVVKKLIRVNHYALVDYFGPDAKDKHQMPFCYEDEPKFYFEDRDLGVDFGVIPLRYYYQSAIKANGIEPFQREHWIGSNGQEFEVYAMLGTPSDLVEPLNPPGAEVSRFGANVCATLVSIRKTQDIPDDIDAPEGDWFVGRVGVSFSMKGMSGGPVFGFRQNAEDQWQYKPVAIQSRWFESHKLIYATPISPIMQAFEEFARRICDEEGTEEPSGHHQRESPGS